MKDRIIKFLTHENLTATKFADEIGVQRSSISHILSGRNNPSFEFIQKILSRYKHINADWLITGSGTMVKKSEPQDLFAPIQPTNPTHIPENIPLPKATPPSSGITFPGDDLTTRSSIEPEILHPRKVEKILIFYSDKTFEEFFPTKA